MKISKLFHWLYALVMLLPIFAIGVTCLITTFNKESKIYNVNAEETQYTNVTDANTFVIGNQYNFNNANINMPSTSTTYNLNFYVENLTINYSPYSWLNSSTRRIQIYRIANYSATSLTMYSYDENNVALGSATFTKGETLINFDFEFNGFQSITNYSYFTSLFYTKEVQNNNYSIVNTFYYAVDKVTESPLFSWAYDSFLVAPFSYIVALFSMPTNNVVVQLLSYWLAISIIWLVFDLVMYVPLLVHRWLDKGVLE